MTSETLSSTAARRSPGWRAYFAFMLGCTFFGYAFIQRVAPSVMVDDLMRDFAVGGALLGNLSAFYFYAYASIQLPVGVLLDRFGPRHLLAVTALLAMLGSVLFAFSDSLTVASIGRALIGASVAFAYVGSLTIAGYWFPPHRFALMVGILQTVGMTGAVAGQAPMGALVDTIGWRDAILVLAGVAFILAVLIYAIVRDKHEARSAKGQMFHGVGSVLKNRDTWLIAVAGLSLTAPMLAFAGLWAVPWLQSEYGFSKTDAAITASLLFLAWGAASPFIGWLSDRTGRRKPVVVIGILVAAGSLATIIHVPDLSPTVLRLLFVSSGIGGCTMILTFAQVKEVNVPRAAGAAMGIVNMCVVGSGAIMQPLIGWLLDSRWDGLEVNGARIYDSAAYGFALSALLVTYALGLIALLLSQETYCRQIVSAEPVS